MVIGEIEAFAVRVPNNIVGSDNCWILDSLDMCHGRTAEDGREDLDGGIGSDFLRYPRERSAVVDEIHEQLLGVRRGGYNIHSVKRQTAFRGEPNHVQTGDFAGIWVIYRHVIGGRHARRVESSNSGCPVSPALRGGACEVQGS